MSSRALEVSPQPTNLWLDHRPTTIRAEFTTCDARIIAIFLAGNNIDLKHRLTIIIFNIFSSFNKLTWPEIHQKTSPSSCFAFIFENRHA